MTVARQVLEVLPHAVAQAQIMMTLQQKAEQRQVRMAFPQRLDPQGLQFAECSPRRGPVAGQVKRLAIP